MTSRARPGNRLPWGPALLPDTNQSLPAEADRPAPVSGAQQTPASRAACKPGEPAPTHLPLAGEDWPGRSRHLAPPSHTHTLPPMVTSHPRPHTSEHTDAQSARSPQEVVTTAGWAPGAAGLGRLHSGRRHPRPAFPLRDPGASMGLRQGGRGSRFTGGSGAGSERPGERLKFTRGISSKPAHRSAPHSPSTTEGSVAGTGTRQAGNLGAGPEDSGAGELGLRRKRLPQPPRWSQSRHSEA